MDENVIKVKSFEFAVRVVNLYKFISSERNEYILSKQLLRSGTSVGANVREALNAQSTADFIHKLSIAKKECDETRYWIELLAKTHYLEKAESDSIHNDATEILKILGSIIMTARSNNS